MIRKKAIVQGTAAPVAIASARARAWKVADGPDPAGGPGAVGVVACRAASFRRPTTGQGTEPGDAGAGKGGIVSLDFVLAMFVMPAAIIAAAVALAWRLRPPGDRR